jgi:hypothetical protein
LRLQRRNKVTLVNRVSLQVVPIEGPTRRLTRRSAFAARNILVLKLQTRAEPVEVAGVKCKPFGFVFVRGHTAAQNPPPTWSVPSPGTSFDRPACLHNDLVWEIKFDFPSIPNARAHFTHPWETPGRPPVGCPLAQDSPVTPALAVAPTNKKRKSPRLQTEYLPYRIACRTMEHLRTQDVRCLTGARTLVFQSRNMNPRLKRIAEGSH